MPREPLWRRWGRVRRRPGGWRRRGRRSTGGSTGGAGGTTVTTGTGGFTTVFTILLENHDYNEIVGSKNAPYLNSLIDTYGLATNYFDSGVHPSLPNYLYLVSGATQYPGGVNVGPQYAPYFPSPADNLGAQMENAGIPWRAYQENMGVPCNLSNFGTYVPKHNPFIYFTSLQKAEGDLCAKRDVDDELFDADLAGGAYKYMWITPDLVHDGHDPAAEPVTALRQSDKWMSHQVPKILASEAYQKGGALFITWDEAEGRNGNDLHQVPMIVVSPKLKSPGMKVATKLTHASYLATMEDLFGCPRLGAAADSPTLFEFFE